MTETWAITREQAKACSCPRCGCKKGAGRSEGRFSSNTCVARSRRSTGPTQSIAAVSRCARPSIPDCRLRPRMRCAPACARSTSAAAGAARQAARDRDAEEIETLIRSLDTWPGLLAAGDIVPAIVSAVSEREATVRVGPGEGVLPVAEMLWVYGQGREERMKSPGRCCVPATCCWCGCSRPAPRACGLASHSNRTRRSRARCSARMSAPARCWPWSEASISPQPVQPRAAGTAPAGLGLQAPDLCGGPRERRLDSASVIDDSPIEFENRDDAAKVKVGARRTSRTSSSGRRACAWRSTTRATWSPSS